MGYGVLVWCSGSGLQTCVVDVRTRTEGCREACFWGCTVLVFLGVHCARASGVVRCSRFGHVRVRDRWVLGGAPLWWFRGTCFRSWGVPGYWSLLTALPWGMFPPPSLTRVRSPLPGIRGFLCWVLGAGALCSCWRGCWCGTWGSVSRGYGVLVWGMGTGATAGLWFFRSAVWVTLVLLRLGLFEVVWGSAAGARASGGKGKGAERGRERSVLPSWVGGQRTRLAVLVGRSAGGAHPRHSPYEVREV